MDGLGRRVASRFQRERAVLNATLSRATSRLCRIGIVALSQFVWLLFIVLAMSQALIWWLLTPPVQAIEEFAIQLQISAGFRRPVSLGVLEHFAIQLSALAVVACLLALLMRRWARLVLLAILVASLAWPVLSPAGQVPGTSGQERLRVLSANLWRHSKDHARTIDTLMRSEADIIGLTEVSPRWRRALRPLTDKYPYRVDCFALESYCQVMLLSRMPIVKPYVGRIWKTQPIIAGGEIDWRGRRFTVLVTHLIWPLPLLEKGRGGPNAEPGPPVYLSGLVPDTWQAREASNLARFLNELPPQLVIMGDFNGAPWSRVQQAFRSTTGLNNQAGWNLSWPAWMPWPLRLPIDHVLTRGDLVVTQFDDGPRTDSDHLPVIAEIGWQN